MQGDRPPEKNKIIATLLVSEYIVPLTDRVGSIRRSTHRVRTEKDCYRGIVRGK